MALKGNAFVAIWHDFDPEFEAEYEQWHTVEHMPERLGVPGFVFGRRYVNRSLDLYRYFTLYQGEELTSFNSPAYLERLNNPTPWSLKIHPHFRNFIRSAAEVTQSHGVGYAKNLTTIRISTDNQDGLNHYLAANLAALSERYGISGVHLGLSRAEVTNVETEETKLRGTELPYVFDALLMIEGFESEFVIEAAAEAARIVNESALGTVVDVLDYELGYALESQS
ncbi:MAG: hypothetical protein WBA28_05930 [Microbacteriaceae bacterium]